LAVLESTAAEFASFRRTQTRNLRKRSKHRRNHGAPTVKLKLGNVLAGFAMGSGKPEYERLVNGLAIAPADLRQLRLSRRSYFPGKRLHPSPPPHTTTPHSCNH